MNVQSKTAKDFMIKWGSYFSKMVYFQPENVGDSVDNLTFTNLKIIGTFATLQDKWLSFTVVSFKK